ncbi:MAG: adenylate kinase [Phoenicibacter congonensis]|uniref:Adenylate kinase n=1 Tax=Phoenicibacter congonensis TaxID=1944646 RepID=A0AA43RK70_9ACTN|nr:adenylate kinase [Phoenicibacter congonensis]
MNIVLLGAPGAGKGTQAEKLVAEFGLCHISTGDILRAAVKNETELGLKAKAYMDAGDLVPDDLIIDLMRERIQQPDTEKGVILDGFPRTTTQAVALDAMLKDLERPLDAALLVDVEPEVIVGRLTSRRMCKACGHIGTAANGPVCTECGGEMYQRDDDNETTVRNRLEVYATSTAPLIDYYKGCDLLVTVDGDRDPDVVYADVKAKLQK